MGAVGIGWEGLLEPDCDARSELRAKGLLRMLCMHCIRFWGITWLGNWAGSLFAGGLIDGADIINKEATVKNLSKFVQSKLQFVNRFDNAEGWFRDVLSGMVVSE